MRSSSDLEANWCLVPVETTLYDLLGISPTASEGLLCGVLYEVKLEDWLDLLAEIKKAYRNKVYSLPFPHLTLLNNF